VAHVGQDAVEALDRAARAAGVSPSRLAAEAICARVGAAPPARKPYNRAEQAVPRVVEMAGEPGGATVARVAEAFGTTRHAAERHVTMAHAGGLVTTDRRDKPRTYRATALGRIVAAAAAEELKERGPAGHDADESPDTTNDTGEAS
jgi:hypothetical protein